MKLDDVNCASVVHTCLLLNAPTLLILIVGVLIVTVMMLLSSAVRQSFMSY